MTSSKLKRKLQADLAQTLVVLFITMFALPMLFLLLGTVPAAGLLITCIIAFVVMIMCS